MILKNKIQQEIKQALKAGNQQKLEVLRFLNAQIINKEIEQGKKALTDEQIIKLIDSQIKKAEESLEFFQKAKREELIKKAQGEIKILKSYLPTQLSEEELEKEIEQIIKENPDIAQPGPLIGISVKKLSGKADNKRISQLVMEKLKEAKI
jgi:uncharacterized protein YqeY